MGDADASPREVPAAEPESVASALLRRSKRDSLAKSDPAKTAANELEEPSQQQRRSQRSGAKSTYSTVATATAAATKEDAAMPQRESTGKKTPKATPEAEAEPPVRRTRPARGATTPTQELPSSTPTSPVRTEPSTEAVSTVMLTPTRRRPSRRQLELDSTAARQSTDRSQLLLGQFSANDATALCEVVWYQIKENSYRGDVLMREWSPACIDWQRVAERLARSHEISLPPRECQRLWKFLAYAQEPASDETKELVADSEPEDYELTVEKINKRQEPVATVLEEATDTPSLTEAAPADTEKSNHAAPVVSSQETVVMPAVTLSTDRVVAEAGTVVAAHRHVGGSAATPRQTLRSSGAQLFPVYDQPSGIPDGWQKTYNYKASRLPLVFVAEKFLKRKVVAPLSSAQTPSGDMSSTVRSAEVDPNVLAAAAMSVTLTGEKTQPKVKGRKRLSEGGGDDKKVKKPRKKKDPTTPTTTTTPTAKPPLGINTNLATSKLLMPARPSFTPSATPPPDPIPARTAFDFFCRLYKENPAIVRASGADPSGTEENKAEASTAQVPERTQLEVLLANAPLHVRTACEQMASDDVRRFEREELRRRLWEKARASFHNSPAPSAPSTPASLQLAVAGPIVTHASVGGTTSQISS